jgi:DNA-binding NarL/FixJ family response regulator
MGVGLGSTEVLLLRSLRNTNRTDLSVGSGVVRRAMKPEQAVEYALSGDDLPGSRPTTSYPADLSSREAEMLRLVARGLTNAQ